MNTSSQPQGHWNPSEELRAKIISAMGGTFPDGDDNDVAVALGLMSARKYLAGELEQAYQLYLLDCEVMNHPSPVSREQLFEHLERGAANRVAIADDEV